jgi:hypothetical protein
MGKITRIDDMETHPEGHGVIPHQADIIEVTNDILMDARSEIAEKVTFSMPIAQLATLGAGVSSLIPALHTVTQTTTVNAQGLYRLANAGVGDALKVARNGNFWGAFKCADGTSKFAQLQSAGPLTATSTATVPIDPATMLMAIALFSIEQKLDSIAEMQKQILTFLEVEKESEIEADVETLVSMISKYKYNWDNEHYLQSNHKMVLDLQRTARKNMLSYQKQVTEVLNSRQLVVAQMNVKSTLKDLLKKFKYYRLSLYTFSLASLLEIMLSGNFKEEYITGIKEEIESLSMTYRDLYGKCSEYLERLGNSALEANLLKGIGNASNAVGKLIGSIPKIKDGQVDEFLQDSGERLKNNAVGMERNVVKAFAEISNPGTGVFTERMRDMILIYNHTAEICFDDKQIYLIAG